MKKFILSLCISLYVFSLPNFASNVQRTVVHSESLVFSEWSEILGSSNYTELPFYPESAKLTIETCKSLNKASCDYFIVREGRVCKDIITVLSNCKKSECEFQFEQKTPKECAE